MHSKPIRGWYLKVQFLNVMSCIPAPLSTIFTPFPTPSWLVPITQFLKVMLRLLPEIRMTPDESPSPSPRPEK